MPDFSWSRIGTTVRAEGGRLIMAPGNNSTKRDRRRKWKLTDSSERAEVGTYEEDGVSAARTSKSPHARIHSSSWWLLLLTQLSAAYSVSLDGGCWDIDFIWKLSMRFSFWKIILRPQGKYWVGWQDKEATEENMGSSRPKFFSVQLQACILQGVSCWHCPSAHWWCWKQPGIIYHSLPKAFAIPSSISVRFGYLTRSH